MAWPLSWVLTLYHSNKLTRPLMWSIGEIFARLLA